MNSINPLSASSEWNPLLDLQFSPDFPGWILVVLACLIAFAAVWATFTDLFRAKTIPDAIPYIGIPTGIIMTPFVYENWGTHMAWMAGIALVFFLMSFWGLGMGDVKLATAMGAWFGPAAAAMLFWSWMIAGAVVLPLALVLRLKGHNVRNMPIALGPFIAASILIGLPALGFPTLLSGIAWFAFAGVIIWGIIEPRVRPLTTLDQLLERAVDRDARQIQIKRYEKPLIDGVPETDTSLMSCARMDWMLDKALKEHEEHSLWYAKNVAVFREVKGVSWFIEISLNRIGGANLIARRSQDVPEPEFEERWEEEMKRAEKKVHRYFRKRYVSGRKSVAEDSHLERSEDSIIATISVKGDDTEDIPDHFLGLPIKKQL